MSGKEIFEKRLEDKFGDKVKLLGDFIKMKSETDFLCTSCGRVWNMKPSNVLMGNGCKECNNSIREDDIKERVQTACGGKFEVLEVLGRRRVKVRCTDCGYEKESDIYHLINGVGCNRCSNRERIDNDKFQTLLMETHNGNISVEEEYKSVDSKLVAKCNICGEEFHTSKYRLINAGKGCPNICVKKGKYSEYAKIKMGELYGEDFEMSYSDEIINSFTDVNFKCKECGTESNYNLKYSIRGKVFCRTCNPTGSMEEIEFANSVRECINVEVHTSKKIKDPKKEFYREIDVYLPEYNLGIEYDGLYWHSDDVIHKNANVDKIEYLKNIHNIRTIVVRQDEWVYKKDIVLSRIRNIVGKTEKKIYARKCEIREISNTLKNEFLNRYHIQGEDKSSLRLGLYYRNKIVSVMTFSKSRNSVSSIEDMSSNVYELVRFCNRTDLLVVGGMSKLLKYAEKILKSMEVKKIKTFADRRWSYGNSYEKLGFKLSNVSSPNYVYFKGNSTETYSRVMFQKHKLSKILENYNENQTEIENMRNNSYGIYWDCGNLVYYKDIK